MATLTMPNSAACLIELIVSWPALARPVILAFEAWGLQQEGREILRAERMADAAQHLATRCLHDGRRVALQRMTKGMVGGQEVPGTGFCALSGLTARTT